MPDPSAPLLPGVPLVESPFFEARLAAAGLAPELERAARELRERGVLVIDFDDPELDALAADIVRDLEGKHAGPHGKVLDAWRTHAGVRRIASNARALELLGALYGRRAIPFQTLNFHRGTEQAIHSDSVHFSSVPERFMCAVWVAFEDIDADNGPLVYYPGSHRLPIYEFLQLGRTATRQTAPYQFYGAYERLFRELVEAHGLAPETLRVPKGKAIVWAANLIHGGAPQRDRSRSRHSQVTHYYFENCAYYTPMLSDPFLGRIHFKDVVDIRSGARVAHRYNGDVVEPPRPARPRRGVRDLLRGARRRLGVSQP